METIAFGVANVTGFHGLKILVSVGLVIWDQKNISQLEPFKITQVTKRKKKRKDNLGEKENLKWKEKTKKW